MPGTTTATAAAVHCCQVRSRLFRHFGQKNTIQRKSLAFDFWVKIRVKNAFLYYILYHVLIRKIVSLILKFVKIYLFTCQNLKKYFSATFVKIDVRAAINFLGYFRTKQCNFPLSGNSDAAQELRDVPRSSRRRSSSSFITRQKFVFIIPGEERDMKG